MLHHMHGRGPKPVSLIALSATLALGALQSASAATLCVNPGGTAGCFAKIQAAVSAASANDTIKVAPGTYKEDVIIGTPLSLIGANRENTIINAIGMKNGIYVDGIDHSGLSSVVVSGFTVENADFEGILVANASSITVWDNEVTGNNKGLNATAATCPNQPPFETNEGFDCGEGIHLTGVYYSIVSDNIVEHNAGGILLSDDTGATHDNLISANVVRENPFDCGITLASHSPASLTGSSSPLGVFHNTISGNESSRNGLAVAGAGAGVGIFDSVPGTKNYANVVINNKLTDNGLPGVAMHSHAPGQNLDDNTIVGNYIAGNGADTEDAATPGKTGINVFGVSPTEGTIISQNVIKDEAVQIAVNTPAHVEIHLNNFFDDTLGVDNLGTGSVDATENWWACAGGPKGGEKCTSVEGPDVLFTPWLTKPLK
jgi:parallel beta-helix repeat protein